MPYRSFRWRPDLAPPGVTAARGMAWIVEGKLDYRDDPKLEDKDPGVFKLFAVPLPQR